MNTFNPWESFKAKHQPNDRIRTTISRVSDFGLFVSLEGGINGLVHTSDIDWVVPGLEAIKSYTVGDTVDVVVLSIDAERQRISLGIKQLGPEPGPDQRPGDPHRLH